MPVDSSPGLGLPREESRGALEDVALLLQAPDALTQLPELLALGAGVSPSSRSRRSIADLLGPSCAASAAGHAQALGDVTDRPARRTSSTASRRNSSGYGGLVFGMPVHPSRDACVASAQDSAKPGEFHPIVRTAFTRVRDQPTRIQKSAEGAVARRRRVIDSDRRPCYRATHQPTSCGVRTDIRRRFEPGRCARAATDALAGCKRLC